MRQQYYKLLTSGTLLFSMSCVSASVLAAEPVRLQNQPIAFLQSFSAGATTLKQQSTQVDFNQTTHVRLRQLYAGYPVWGGEVIEHIPQNKKTSGTVNGLVYQRLDADLQNTPAYIFHSEQANKALQQAIQLYQQKNGTKNTVQETQSNLIVFVDKDNKAHWAFHINFLVEPREAIPEKPNFIMDAVTFAVYQTWNNIQTVDAADGGGFGGNQKMGKLVYDDLANNYPKLSMQRNNGSKTCFLKNTDVTVRDARHGNTVEQFACEKLSAEHNNIYWNADQDAANGAYSPGNDALYAGKVIKEMYQKWYGIPVLTKNGKPMMLDMVVHANMENAYWDGTKMVFGDGASYFYPLVSLGVGAHEISHGFTEQHSNLVYQGQSGGLNESFSDMAAQAAEFYSVGHNSWQIGPEIMKQTNQALRYMDEPTKDCASGDRPGDDCSISHIKDYRSDEDVHFTSGIFNKLFYLMGTTEGWDTKKAFDVMVQANAHYWTSTTSFADAACGVVKATQDYKYNLDAVQKAATQVGIDTSKC